jgi:hypothetical protein
MCHAVVNYDSYQENDFWNSEKIYKITRCEQKEKVVGGFHPKGTVKHATETLITWDAVNNKAHNNNHVLNN